MTDHIVFRQGSILALIHQSTGSGGDRDKGDMGMEMMCSLSNDAGMVMGVVVVMRKG